MIPHLIGIDPGETTGILAWLPGEPADFVQCTPDAVLPIVSALIRPDSVLIPERFIVGARASRSKTPQAGATARTLLELIAHRFGERHRIICRAAAEVKPWATDDRLKRAGLYCPEMRHARDAARHALFSAMHDFAFPDPLSKRA